MLKLAQGAEAIIYKDNQDIIKERFSKDYRLKHLDESLRKFRTRREAKILGKLEEMGFPAPKMKEFSDKRMSITMDFVPGEKLKDVMEQDYAKFAVEIGRKVGELHTADIIHGDLTTSNMIWNEKGMNFIDFGLAQFSDKVEDKGVDLFLLDRALASTHYQFYPEIFDKVLEGYKETNDEYAPVVERFEAVSRRGRNKKK